MRGRRVLKKKMRKRLTCGRIAWTVGLLGSALVAATFQSCTETAESIALTDDLVADGSYGDAA